MRGTASGAAVMATPPGRVARPRSPTAGGGSRTVGRAPPPNPHDAQRRQQPRPTAAFPAAAAAGPPRATQPTLWPPAGARPRAGTPQAASAASLFPRTRSVHAPPPSATPGTAASPGSASAAAAAASALEGHARLFQQLQALVVRLSQAAVDDKRRLAAAERAVADFGVLATQQSEMIEDLQRRNAALSRERDMLLDMSTLEQEVARAITGAGRVPGGAGEPATTAHVLRLLKEERRQRLEAEEQSAALLTQQQRLIARLEAGVGARGGQATPGGALGAGGTSALGALSSARAAASATAVAAATTFLRGSARGAAGDADRAPNGISAHESSWQPPQRARGGDDETFNGGGDDDDNPPRSDEAAPPAPPFDSPITIRATSTTNGRPTHDEDDEEFGDARRSASASLALAGVPIAPALSPPAQSRRLVPGLALQGVAGWQQRQHQPVAAERVDPPSGHPNGVAGARRPVGVLSPGSSTVVPSTVVVGNGTGSGGGALRSDALAGVLQRLKQQYGMSGNTSGVSSGVGRLVASPPTRHDGDQSPAATP